MKDYDRRKPDATVIDYTLYSEDIGNETHSISKVGLHYDTVSRYVDELLSQICEFSAVTAQDKQQLERSILSILTD